MNFLEVVNKCSAEAKPMLIEYSKIPDNPRVRDAALAAINCFQKLHIYATTIDKKLPEQEPEVVAQTEAPKRGRPPKDS